MSKLDAVRQFRGSISRRAGFVLAALVALVGVVGGVSVTLAIGIFRDLDALSEEYQHIVVLDQARAAFHDLEFDLYQATLGNRNERLADAVLHGQEFARLVAALGEQHAEEARGSTGDIEAIPLLLLQGQEIGAIAQSLADSAAGLNDSQSQTLFRAVGEVHRAAEELTALHRSRITGLLDASEDRMAAIVALYIAFLLLAGVLIVATAVAARRQVALPLRRLADAAREISDGHWSARVPVRSDDEIGLLSHGFNAMATRLQEHEAELRRTNQALEGKVQETQALYRIGTEIARLQQLDRVLQSVVDKARELLHVDAAALCLFDSRSTQLEAEATSGPPDAFRTGAQAFDCKPLRGDAEEVRSAVSPVIRPEFARAHLAAPFRLRDGDQGVIYVSSREERQFMEAESELLSALATQAAIAIDRAKLTEMLRSVATVEERSRLAREMHDGLAQSLALLHLKLQGALARTADPHAVGQILRELIHITDQAYEDVRQSILALRAPVLREAGFAAVLAEYLKDLRAHNGIDVDLEVSAGNFDQLPPGSEAQAIRIIQEALTNVRRHARVDRARVRLERADAAVRVTIQDDGVGWDLRSGNGGGHYGLQTMRERAESVGGRLDIETFPGAGTRIVATLPGEGR